MPYQSIASLGVIIAMFNVVPALNSGIQALAYGVSCLSIRYFAWWINRSIDDGSIDDGSIAYTRDNPLVALNRSHFVQSSSSFSFSITIKTTTVTIIATQRNNDSQKKKELGLCANEWNYRMVKRDASYQEHVQRVKAEMDKNAAMNNSLRVQS